MEMEKVVQRKEEVPMEELIPPSSICELDVKEWAMELRENNIVMDEFNAQVKEEKMKNIEEIEYRQRKAREEEIGEKERKIEDQRRKLEEERILMEEQIARQNDIFEREKVVNLREKELIYRKQSLKEMELEINEKNSILEITLKMKETEEMLFQQKNKSDFEMVQNEAQLNISRGKDIAMREKELAVRHQKLDRKESQIEEKSKIFEMAIQMNEFR